MRSSSLTNGMAEAGSSLGGSRMAQITPLLGDRRAAGAATATLPARPPLRPRAPKILRIVPAWHLAAVGSGVRGSFLRAYLERPYRTAADELLGVIDAANGYQILDVQHDPAADEWYTDIRLDAAPPELLPAGYSAQLALVRFRSDPSSDGPVSPVVRVTFSLPAADRAVCVVRVGDARTARVLVSAPAGDLQPDRAGGSAMVVDLEVQDADWAFDDAKPPLLLAPALRTAARGFLTWEGEVELPGAHGSAPRPQRLRVSEIGYRRNAATATVYAGGSATRRPFACHVPID